MKNYQSNYQKYKKIKNINQKIEKHEIIEKNNIKEEAEFLKRMETKILDETKAFEEIETKLRNLKTTMLKKWFWHKTDEQEIMKT